jgi:hypothetical protein
MAITVFDFGNVNDFATGAANYTVTKNGITATLSNYRGNNSNFVINSNSSGTGNGILMAQYQLPFQTGYRFDLALAASSGNPVQIVRYIVRTTNISSDLTFTNASQSSTLNDFTNSGSFSLDNSPFIASSTTTVRTVTKLNSSTPAQSYLAGIEVQAVPFESDVLPLVGATILFGGGMWWKRRRGTGQLDLTGQRVEKEQDNG